MKQVEFGIPYIVIFWISFTLATGAIEFMRPKPPKAIELRTTMNVNIYTSKVHCATNRKEFITPGSSEEFYNYVMGCN